MDRAAFFLVNYSKLFFINISPKSHPQVLRIRLVSVAWWRRIPHENFPRRMTSATSPDHCVIRR